MSVRTREEARAFRAKLDGLISTADDGVALTAVEVFPAWRPDGGYTTGDRVRYGGTLYRCLQPHAAQSDWPPDAAVSLWVAVADPAVEWPDWVQPKGSHDAYAAGDKVAHGGKRWTSTADGNVWEPGAYGWEEYNG